MPFLTTQARKLQAAMTPSQVAKNQKPAGSPRTSSMPGRMFVPLLRRVC